MLGSFKIQSKWHNSSILPNNDEPMKKGEKIIGKKIWKHGLHVLYCNWFDWTLKTKKPIHWYPGSPSISWSSGTIWLTIWASQHQEKWDALTSRTLKTVSIKPIKTLDSDVFICFFSGEIFDSESQKFSRVMRFPGYSMLAPTTSAFPYISILSAVLRGIRSSRTSSSIARHPPRSGQLSSGTNRSRWRCRVQHRAPKTGSMGWGL